MVTREAFDRHKKEIWLLLAGFKKDFPEVLDGMDLIAFDETYPAWAYDALKKHLENYSAICKTRCERLLVFSIFDPIFLYTNYGVALSLAREKYIEIAHLVENPQSVRSQVKSYYW